MAAQLNRKKIRQYYRICKQNNIFNDYSDAESLAQWLAQDTQQSLMRTIFDPGYYIPQENYNEITNNFFLFLTNQLPGIETIDDFIQFLADLPYYKED